MWEEAWPKLNIRCSGQHGSKNADTKYNESCKTSKTEKADGNMHIVVADLIDIGMDIVVADLTDIGRYS